jgi:hypothetical protein
LHLPVLTSRGERREIGGLEDREGNIAIGSHAIFSARSVAAICSALALCPTNFR